MSENTTQHLSVEALPDYEPTVGRWLWACEDTRRQTRDILTGLEQAVFDWIPFQGGNSIGTLLYHIPETIRERLAELEAIGVQEIILGFPDILHLDTLRFFAHECLAEAGERRTTETTMA